MHKTFKNKAQGCSTPLTLLSTAIINQEYFAFSITFICLSFAFNTRKVRFTPICCRGMHHCELCLWRWYPTAQHYLATNNVSTHKGNKHSIILPSRWFILPSLLHILVKTGWVTLIGDFYMDRCGYRDLGLCFGWHFELFWCGCVKFIQKLSEFVWSSSKKKKKKKGFKGTIHDFFWSWKHISLFQRQGKIHIIKRINKFLVKLLKVWRKKVFWQVSFLVVLYKQCF